MKRLLATLSALAALAFCALPAPAAEPIAVVDGITVSADYDWTRFAGQNVTLNVYNWGEYISNGSDDSIDVVDAFEKLTGISVNYTTFDSNESMYAKLKSGAASYDVIIPSDYMVAKMIDEEMLLPTRNTATPTTTPPTPTPCPICSAPPASSTTPPWWARPRRPGPTCGTSSMPAAS